MTTWQDVFNGLAGTLEDRLAAYQGEIQINGEYQIRGSIPNRNLAPLNLSGSIFTGILQVDNGGTGLDLDGEPPGVLRWDGNDVLTSPIDFNDIDFNGAAGSFGHPLILTGTGAGAAFVAMDLNAGTGTLLATKGGTEQSSYAVGDLLYASSTTALSKLADVATGNALISGGVSTAPAWGKVGLTTHISGILAGTNGGTGVNNGAFLLTVPATGTAALRASAATANHVSFWSSATEISHSTLLTWDGAKFVIGGGTTIRPGTFMEAYRSDTTAGTSNIGASFEANFNPSASQLTVAKIGGAFLSVLDGSGGVSAAGSLQGLLAELWNQQTTGTFSGPMIALNCQIRITSGSNVATGDGLRVAPVLSGAGNLTDWRGVFINSPTRSSTGSITNAYGVYINRQKIAAGVTNGWGVYQADANDNNFFAGSVIMQEITAPGAPAANQGVLYLDDNGAGKTRLMIRFNTGAVQQIAIQP